MRVVALGDRDERYLTHREIDAALALFPSDIDAAWVGTDSPGARDFDEADGIWLLPGSPYRDDEAALAAIRYCVDTGTPFLGTCAGFQYACVELVRSLAGRPDAAHAESQPDAADPVVVPLACSLYGEVRSVQPIKGTRLAAICGETAFDGYHHCGFGLSAPYAEVLMAHGVTIGATAPDAGVEAIEIVTHPFFVATSFQPQVGVSTAHVLPPLLTAFLAVVRACASERSRS